MASFLTEYETDILATISTRFRVDERDPKVAFALKKLADHGLICLVWHTTHAGEQILAGETV